jgi:hypothetical protein
MSMASKRLIERADPPPAQARRTRLLAALCLALAGAASACGPDFPVTLLDARPQTLLELSEGVFDYEVTRLLPQPLPALAPVDGDTWTAPEEQRATAENVGLDAAAIAQIVAMRASDSAASAEAAGQGLPDELRLYTAGAVAWQQGAFDPAHAYFRAVLELPPAERRLRGAWASYMDGQALELNGDEGGATEAYERTRLWVSEGASDPDGLGVASFGEQAKMRLDAGDAVAAVHLYAQQAAYASRSGRNSLLFVARRAFVDPDMRETLLGDTLGRQLLVAYLFARSHELERLTPPPDADPYDLPLAPPNHQAVLALLDRLSELPVADLPESDRLAAVAYRAGRYEQAERFAAANDAPLAAWVRAKLALRKGDQVSAASAFAQAAKAFPADEEWGPVPVLSDGYFTAGETLKPQCRVQAEAGTLALARGDYVQALELLYAGAGTYWTDAAYVAERVLDVDELKAFVDRVAAQPATAAAIPAVEDPDEMLPFDAKTSLRWLLARRLLREGRLDQAAAYFDAPELRSQATEYVAARKRAESAFFKVDKARAWFDAARLARHNGMELLGYEGDPDYLIWGGDYDLNDPTTYDAEYNAIHNPRSDLKVDGDFTSDGERARLGASRAQPLERFHYRLVAADHASHAADLLPPRSQAFAAVLCVATHWLIDRHPEPASALYRRYLNQGAWVAWGNTFGRECPAPDFDKVVKERDALFYKRLGRVGLWMTPILIAFGALVVWRRRERRRVVAASAS